MMNRLPLCYYILKYGRYDRLAIHTLRKARPGFEGLNSLEAKCELQRNKIF